MSTPMQDARREGGTRCARPCQRSGHAHCLDPAGAGPDRILSEQNRSPTQLVPVRIGRMLEGPRSRIRDRCAMAHEPRRADPVAVPARRVVWDAHTRLRAVRVPGAASGLRPRRLRRATTAPWESGPQRLAAERGCSGSRQERQLDSECHAAAQAAVRAYRLGLQACASCGAARKRLLRPDRRRALDLSRCGRGSAGGAHREPQGPARVPPSGTDKARR